VLCGLGLSESNLNYFLVCDEKCYPNVFTEKYIKFAVEYPDTVSNTFHNVSQYVSQPGYPEVVQSINVQVKEKST